MTTSLTSMLGWLQAREQEMVAMVEHWASIESPSDDRSSHRPLLTAIIDEIEAVGFSVRELPDRAGTEARHLFGRPEQRQRHQPNQLLIGHLDTVWPIGTLASMPVHRDGQRLSGPGTYDMKAGLVQAIFALRALQEHDVTPPATPLVLVNADEEIGSRGSRQWVELLAKISARAFVLEGSYGPLGMLKTGRKGVGRFTVRVKGVAAHAGLDPTSGASAVLEISRQIQQIFDLNDLDAGTSVNVGTVDGGLRPNVVAPEATAQIDVRVLTFPEAERVERALQQLSPTDPAVTIDVEGGFNRPPMEQTARNLALWDRANHLAAELDLELDHAVVGGASDGNFASLHTAVLDGLGGVGDGAHAAHEHVLVPYLPERAALLAALLADPVQEAT